ncbi:MAG: hypothetical protein ABI797_01520, partial [Chloroflexota bacterium]
MTHLRAGLIPMLMAVAVALGACAMASPPATASPSPSVGPSGTSPTPTLGSATPAATSSAAASEDLSLLFTWYIDDTSKAAYLVSFDGLGQRRILTDVTGDIRAASWSPAGDRIVFVVRDAEHPDGAISTAAADGTGAALFYDGRDAGCDSVFHPVWSPDASAMSLVCYRDSERLADLAVLDVASMQLTTLASYTWPEFLDGSSFWSRDGTRLAFTVLHWDPTDTFLVGSRIATIVADGSAPPVYRSEFDTNYSSPYWSPDDQQLVFNSYDLQQRDATSNLYTMNLDDSAVDELTLAADAGVDRIAVPKWDPDGTRIWV